MSHSTHNNVRRPLARELACCLLATAGLLAHAAEPVAAPASTTAAAPTSAPVAAAPVPGLPSVFARIGDSVITHEEFEATYAQAARGKFYHGKVPDGAAAALQREVGQSLVDAILLLDEARRRQIQPDAAAVQRTIDGYEERYRGNTHWQANRERLLPGLTGKLERDSVLEQMTQQVKTVTDPTESELQQYWETHQDKFTSPEQVHLSMILLRVDPSSPQAKWTEAGTEGAALVKRARDGADFKELARQHSRDPSAERGGDLGFLHKSMLPDPAQQALEKLADGDVSEPVLLLEGVAVFRLEGRRASRLNPLDVVRSRARDLWKRDQGEEAWTALLARLRRDTPVTIDESRLLPMTTATTATAADDKAAPR